MMKALIIEDERMAQENLQRALARNFPDIQIVGCIASVRAAVEWLGNNSPDMIFMDVELSDGNCFEIFNQVNIEAKVIMTTAYDRYAIKAFEAGSVDYLLKPIDDAALRRAVSRCQANTGIIDAQFLAKALAGPAQNYRQRMLVRFNDRIVPLDISSIAYVYSESKANFAVTYGGGKYPLDQSLEAIGEDLDPKVFFRISRSCIVAMSAIGTITKQVGGRLRIEPKPAADFDMTVSRSRVDDFLLWLER